MMRLVYTFLLIIAINAPAVYAQDSKISISITPYNVSDAQINIGYLTQVIKQSENSFDKLEAIAGLIYIYKSINMILEKNQTDALAVLKKEILDEKQSDVIREYATLAYALIGNNKAAPLLAAMANKTICPSDNIKLQALGVYGLGAIYTPLSTKAFEKILMGPNGNQTVAFIDITNKENSKYCGWNPLPTTILNILADRGINTSDDVVHFLGKEFGSHGKMARQVVEDYASTHPEAISIRDRMRQSRYEDVYENVSKIIGAVVFNIAPIAIGWIAEVEAIAALNASRLQALTVGGEETNALVNQIEVQNTLKGINKSNIGVDSPDLNLNKNFGTKIKGFSPDGDFTGGPSNMGTDVLVKPTVKTNVNTVPSAIITANKTLKVPTTTNNAMNVATNPSTTTPIASLYTSPPEWVHPDKLLEEEEVEVGLPGIPGVPRTTSKVRLPDIKNSIKRIVDHETYTELEGAPGVYIKETEANQSMPTAYEYDNISGKMVATSITSIQEIEAKISNITVSLIGSVNGGKPVTLSYLNYNIEEDESIAHIVYMNTLEHLRNKGLSKKVFEVFFKKYPSIQEIDEIDLAATNLEGFANALMQGMGYDTSKYISGKMDLRDPKYFEAYSALKKLGKGQKTKEMRVNYNLVDDTVDGAADLVITVCLIDPESKNNFDELITKAVKATPLSKILSGFGFKIKEIDIDLADSQLPIRYISWVKSK